MTEVENGEKPPDPPSKGEVQGGTGGGTDVDMTTVNNETGMMSSAPAAEAAKPEKLKVLYDEMSSCNAYKVLVQANNKSSNVGLSYHKLGQELAQVAKDSAEILFKEKLSRDKILIACKNAKSANTLVNDETLSNKYNIFIPQNYVSRFAIIRDIDTDISEKDIFESLETRQFKLNSVQRLNRRTVDESGKVLYVPSRTMKLNFAGQDIPANVYLWYSRIECEPFIQSTLQCYRCMRFGHASNKCKAKFEVCKKCFQVQKPDHVCQTSEIRCLNCDGLHNPKSKNCPELIRQKDIKHLMSTRNLCFQEAVKIIPSVKQSNAARFSKGSNSYVPNAANVSSHSGNANSYAMTMGTYAVNTSNSFSVLGDICEDFPQLPSRGSKDDKLEKYVPPPLPYKPSIARSNKGNPTQRKSLKRYSGPTNSGFDFTKKVRNDKERKENSVAPLFYKMAADSKYEGMVQDNSQSPYSNSVSSNNTLSKSISGYSVGSSSINHNNANPFSTTNQNQGRTGVQLVGPNVRNIRRSNDYHNSTTNNNLVLKNRFVFNSTQNTLQFSDEDDCSDLMDVNHPKSPHLG